MLRCVYADLDGTLLGPGGGLFTGGDKRPSLLGARAVEACARAEVELCVVTGRMRSSMAELARLLGQRSAIFEAGAGVLLDGELHWLTGEWQPQDGRSIHAQIEASGAPALLLEHFKGRLEVHAPWHVGRETSHLLRGHVDAAEADALLEQHGLGTLRLLDNGGVHRRSPDLDPAITQVRAYHLVPRTVSKAAGLAFHRRARQYAAGETIACGDSREDLQMAPEVGRFWLMANAVEDDPSMRAAIGGAPNVRVSEGTYGAGVYEAVVTTLAERGAS
ncbi:MAG: sucrose-6F-phosphate phosphohydrolase [Solirubrobacterales bacterium]|nr:sucrose-6F-phosphate phosphohydrolase [Solirubrobacterales bacterium]